METVCVSVIHKNLPPIHMHTVKKIRECALVIDLTPTLTHSLTHTEVHTAAARGVPLGGAVRLLMVFEARH